MTQTRDLIKKMADFFRGEEFYEKGEDARLELSPDDVRCMNEVIKACGNAISRQAVMDAIIKWVGSMASSPIPISANEVRPLFKSIHELPFVTPKQISCKDCKYFINNATRTINFPNVCRWHDGFNPDEDWFCADFEEKTESEEQNDG